MKTLNKILTTLLISILSISPILAQVGFNYQAAVRNPSGNLVQNQNVNFRLSVLSGSPLGNTEYSETHSVTTNSYGIANLVVGDGTPISGSFGSINWGGNSHFLKVEINISGGTSFTDLGTEQLRSVPYASHAQTVENDNVNDADSDPSNEIQNLNLNGNSLSISNGNSVTLPSGGSGAWNSSGSNIYYNTGDVGIGKSTAPTHLLQVGDGSTNSVFRLTGSNTANEFGARMNFGNGNNVYLEEHQNDQLKLYANDRMWLESPSVNIGTNSNLASGGTADLNVGGSIDGIDANGDVKYTLEESATNQAGRISTWGPNGFQNTGLTSGDPGPDANYGGVLVMDQAGDIKGQLSANFNSGSGDLYLYGTNLSNNILMGGSGSNPNVGVFTVHDATGNTIVLASGITSGGGAVATYGPNGNFNINMSSLSGNNNNGFLAVYGPTSNEAGVFVDATGDGIVFGDQKNFRMEHPEQEGKEIWYASLEGPELGAYCRGTGTLVNGEAVINLPDHFRLVANSQDMTVQITPLSADSKGMAVISKSNTSFTVKELLAGSGNYDFDWEVKSIRNGYENYRVIRDASELEAIIGESNTAESLKVNQAPIKN